MESIRVAVFQSGAIEIDGVQATASDLGTALDRIRAKHGGVQYYQEGAGQEPTAAQMNVFKMIIDARLPVSLSSKPDFSDCVGEDGLSHPRH